MSEIDIYQVDAFTTEIFKGNPAAVCPLKSWLPDEMLLAMACEHNQSETAYFIPTSDGYELRWFTTEGEINLCGHATLASSHVIFNHLNYPKNEIHFTTRFVGPLIVKRDGAWLTMDFPTWMPEVVDIPAGAEKALGGAKIKEAHVKRDYLFLFESEDEIAKMEPNFQALTALEKRICVTAPGKNCDFVSRFFTPRDEAYKEDPVTGSSHSMLIPYWASRLGKTKMLARQLSARGGELRCELAGERVYISGQAKTYMQGKIVLP